MFYIERHNGAGWARVPTGQLSLKAQRQQNPGCFDKSDDAYQELVELALRVEFIARDYRVMKSGGTRAVRFVSANYISVWRSDVAAKRAKEHKMQICYGQGD